MKKAEGQAGTGKIQRFRLYISRGIFLLAAAGFILTGILQGEHDAVMAKAIRICLECVGIG